jgi:hypothetical protein
VEFTLEEKEEDLVVHVESVGVSDGWQEWESGVPLLLELVNWERVPVDAEVGVVAAA